MNDLSTGTNKKTAAVVIALGAEKAAKIYRYMSAEEVERLTRAVARTDYASHDEIGQVLNDFLQMCVTRQVILEGGESYAGEVLRKAFGDQEAEEMLGKIKARVQENLFDFLKTVEPHTAAAVLAEEHPQLVAVTLAYAESASAARILSCLPQEKSLGIIERVARLGKVRPEMLKLLAKTLESKFDLPSDIEYQKYGGVDSVADILSNLDYGSEKQLFEGLRQSNADLAHSVSEAMFVFEDLTLLQEKDAKKVFRLAEPMDLVYALRDAPEEIARCVYDNISKRMLESLKLDMELTQDITPAQTDLARKRIVTIVRRLQSDGEIVVDKARKDETLA